MINVDEEKASNVDPNVNSNAQRFLLRPTIAQLPKHSVEDSNDTHEMTEAVDLHENHRQQDQLQQNHEEPQQADQENYETHMEFSQPKDKENNWCKIVSLQSLRIILIQIFGVTYWIGWWNLLDLYIFSSDDTTVRDWVYVIIGISWIWTSDVGTYFFGPILYRLKRPGASVKQLMSNQLFDREEKVDLQSFGLKRKVVAFLRVVYSETGAIMLWTGTWNLLDDLDWLEKGPFREICYFVVGITGAGLITILLEDHSLQVFLMWWTQRRIRNRDMAAKLSEPDSNVELEDIESDKRSA